MMDRLTQLGHTMSTPTVLTPPMSLELATEPCLLLYLRLHRLESSLGSVKKAIQASDLGTRPTCLPHKALTGILYSGLIS